jgi:hypothetical protein
MSRLSQLQSWMTSQSPTVIRTLALCVICLPIFALSFWIWRRNSSLSVPEFLGRTADPTHPDINAAPVDLTTAGADVELPDEHPLRKMNGVTPANLSPFHNSHMTKDDLANTFTEFDMRLSNLEKRQ